MTLDELISSHRETLYAYPPPSGINVGDARGLVELGLRNSSQNLERVCLYLHVPFCLHLCQFCGFIKQKLTTRDQLTQAVQELCTEIELVSSRLSSPVKVEAIYLGGGTASVLSAGHLNHLIKTIGDNFDLATPCEMTLEGEVMSLGRRNYLQEASAIGFNRLSFGVQVWDEGYRKLLGLQPSHEQVCEVAEAGMSLFNEVNCDYIYGLPGTNSQFLATDLQVFVSEVKCSAIEAFQFEAYDASPSFIQSVNEFGLHCLRFSQQAVQHNNLFAYLEASDWRRDSYSLARRCGHAPVSDAYYRAYYGWDGLSLLGFGRGAQSFYKGLMWGNNLPAHLHSAALDNGMLPCSTAAQFGPYERELVTWPRRGFISSELICGYGDEDYQLRISEGKSLGLFRDNLGVTYLTDDSWSLVPVVLRHLMSEGTREQFDEVSHSREREGTAL